MDEAKRALVESWLTKALHDLESASTLSERQPPRFDTAVYLCQQGAEKAIKGFLVYHDEIPQKTHLLGLLVAAAAYHDVRFALFLDAADFLTPLATDYRYPGTAGEPTRQAYEMAYKYAEEMYN